MAAKRATGAEKRKLFEAEALPHLDSVYAMAVRLVRNADDANDLLQETVLRAWRFFDQFQPGTNCRAWLLTILFNNFRNGYRRASREQPASATGDFDHRLEAASLSNEPQQGNPETVVSSRSMDREVESAFNSMPDEFRSALLLIDVQELSYREASQVLEVPVGTIKSRVSRGRTLMRQALQSYAKDKGIIRS
ncbi:MAG TPA: sigma-70 family RNA polymerase sigma factor [Candidatus Binataceae bacterium]|nr:sigma-70 family RNA polymerase sigma factor [Candidatus Binataceae bacterium]